MSTPFRALRIVMMGTGPFAVPTFRALLASRHEVAALVTRPDRPAHRREKTPANPMREVAVEHGLSVFEPESINAADASGWLRERAADLLVVCDYGQILSRDALAAARLGGINLHASLLPKYRGAAPIHWAIYHGETETGVTVIHMTPQLDAGPCIVQRGTPIDPEETAPELELRLSQLGAEAVTEAIDVLQRGDNVPGIPQDDSRASKAPRLRKEDGRIDWSRSAGAIANQVRAFQPWPTSYTFWRHRDGEPLRLILERVRVLESSEPVEPGTIMQAQGHELTVACGQGALRIEELRPAGRRPMSAGEFLRGHELQAGGRFE